MKITIRGDSGFSSAPFYKLADDYNLNYAIAVASNQVLKRNVARAERAVKHIRPMVKNTSTLSVLITKSGVGTSRSDVTPK